MKAASCFLVIVLAAAAVPAAGVRARSPDIDHGREIAVNGSEAAAQACAACHKLNGTGEPSGAFPRLTGQGGFYLYKQLKDYAAGLRESQIMGPIAKQLTDIEMQDVAGWYALATGPVISPQSGDPRQIQQGGVLSAVGSPERNIPGCANCHGAAGTGMPPSFPYLAGQFARYTRDQLAAWKDGSRRNDPLNVMRDIAARLGDDDMAAAAQYFAHAHPPDRPALPREFPGGGETGRVPSGNTVRARQP